MALDSLNTPQPAPTEGEGPAVWPTVFDDPSLSLPAWLAADMRERHEAGSRKYGTPLRVWNGRAAVVDAYQEALDLVAYAQQARLRAPSSPNERLLLGVIFHTALQAARHLGELARLEQSKGASR